MIHKAAFGIFTQGWWCIVLLTRRTFAQMCINAHVTSCACQALVLAVWNMFVCLRVNVFLCESKVYYVDNVSPLGRLSADKKVLRFHITINQVLWMYVLHPRYLATYKHWTLKYYVQQNSESPHYGYYEIPWQCTTLLLMWSVTRIMPVVLVLMSMIKLSSSQLLHYDKSIKNECHPQQNHNETSQSSGPISTT